MLSRLFPKQVDNRLEGHSAALWLLGLFIALKLVMSVNSIFNPASVATGADGFRLEQYGADGGRAVLMLFALMSLGQLALAVIALATLIRYRALVPLIYLVLLGEQIARRLIVESYAVSRTEGASAGSYVTFALLALLMLGLVLSLFPVRQRERSSSPA